VLPQGFGGGLLCLPERPVLELVPIRNLLLTEKNGEFVVLNICERIGVRVPVDLSILVT
jgi:hypothetical protein